MVVFNLVRAASNTDVQHIVLARMPGGDLQQKLERSGVLVFTPDRYYGIRETRKSLRFLENLIQDQEIDVLHAHMADASFLAWLLTRRRSLPYVITHHGHDPLPNCNELCRWVHHLLLIVSARAAARNIAVSSSVAERIQRKLFLKVGAVKVLANGVPLPDLQAGSESNLQEGMLRVCSIGRLVKLKGHNQLIEAAAKLVESLPNATFTFLGDGELRESLEAQVSSLGIKKNIVFAGSVDDVADRLRQVNLFISTSHYEGMPMAVLEAMASGVPVIASDVPGNSVVVEHGVNGLLYKAGDVADLLEKVREVVNMPGLAAKRARNARECVESKYSASAVAQRHADLYHEIINGNTGQVRQA